MPSPEFQTPPPPPRDLPAGEVHLWRIRLDQGSEAAAQAVQLLSPDERKRHDRFKLPRLRRRFALARASLRSILAGYLSGPAGELRFHYGNHGKPRLAPERNPRDLRFNLSHSHERAVLAVATGGEIGVDIERLRDNIEFTRLARRFFSRREADMIDDLSGPELRRRFFQIWTAKESYIKAVGAGLRLPLDQFAFEIREGAPPTLVETRHDPAEIRRWTFQQLAMDTDHICTVAWEGARKLRFFRADCIHCGETS